MANTASSNTSNDEGCVQQIADLLKENRLGEAFEILEGHIKRKQELRSHYATLITNSAFVNRAEKQFSLGTISWENYNIANSRVIVVALELAKTVCSYLEEFPAPKSDPATSLTEGKEHHPEPEAPKAMVNTELLVVVPLITILTVTAYFIFDDLLVSVLLFIGFVLLYGVWNFLRRRPEPLPAPVQKRYSSKELARLEEYGKRLETLFEEIDGLERDAGA